MKTFQVSDFFPEKGFYYYYCYYYCNSGGKRDLCNCHVLVACMSALYFPHIINQCSSIQTERKTCCTEMFVFMLFYMWLYIPPSTMQ